LCQVFIDPGDVILVESPTFVHCVEIFEMFQARCIAVAMDDQGMIPEDLEEKIRRHGPKMVYLIPTFHNPTGRTLSLGRRKKIAELGSRHDVLVLEDDPYRDIRYSGEDLKPVKAFDETGHTVLANSFSKIFSPGSRLGYVFASDEIISRLFDAKTATNSHTSMLPQVICAEFFKRGYYPAHHRMICDLYRKRRDTMIECIDQFFPEGTKRTFPDGGLFTWAELPGPIDTTELLVEAVTSPDVKVAFVAGEGFYIEGGGKGKNCMRLSFGSVKPQRIKSGMEKLGGLVRSRI
jgi:2-aminoadipate transaminase